MHCFKKGKGDIKSNNPGSQQDVALEVKQFIEMPPSQHLSLGTLVFLFLFFLVFIPMRTLKS